MTKKKLYLNIWHLFLTLSLITAVFSFYFVNQSAIQHRLVIALSILYVSFSLVHHYKDKSLTFEIILEYILIAVLVMIITFSAVY